MYSHLKWISKLTSSSLLILTTATAGLAQSRVPVRPQALVPADEARDVFNAGQRFYDEYRFADAERQFREVVRRFPANPIADRADYYLIRTLAQVGKKTEALSRIDMFPKQYPKSKWLDDVTEIRIQLTNQIPAKAEYILLQSGAPVPPPAPPSPPPFAPFRKKVQIEQPNVTPPPLQISTATPQPVNLFSQSPDPEVSLQQEMMRAMFRNDANRAMEIVMERLKLNPVDPVVLSSLNLIATSRSSRAMPMLIGIVKNSPNPKARRDAIFWMGQAGVQGDAVVDTLVGLLPSLADDDAESVAYTLSQIRSPKSLSALSAIARDRSKTEKIRNNAVFWLGQSRAANRVGYLEDIYKNSMDNTKVRQQVLLVVTQTGEPQAVNVLNSAATTDPDMEVRKQAAYWLQKK
jgi:hypothetical protein